MRALRQCSIKLEQLTEGSARRARGVQLGEGGVPCIEEASALPAEAGDTALGECYCSIDGCVSFRRTSGGASWQLACEGRMAAWTV